MVGPNAVRLHIGHVYPKLHPVFNLYLVIPYKEPSLNPHHPLPPIEPNIVVHFPSSIDWRRISEILDFQIFKGQRQYLLRWEGCGPAHESWVPLISISQDLDEFLMHFHRLHPQYPSFCVPKQQQRPWMGDALAQLPVMK
ncbi:hypothetical protein O181_029055 [Austropuccinia psidii MF-1]|uniref:Chromo domain-containing protein n=1 Tax=Austropuccinia psidii MF-1 TaxID=1389203 RepID=A0A9Q3H4U3_9BASI|nr:hypothetical protein [Austropuccinia psidii MF-1]